jgi:hypothetical protein
MEDLPRKNFSASHPSLSVLRLQELNLSTIDKLCMLSCRELTFTTDYGEFIMSRRQEARTLLCRHVLVVGHPYRAQGALGPSVAVGYVQ